MASRKTVITLIEQLCAEAQLRYDGGDGGYRIYLNDPSGISLFLSVEKSCTLSLRFVERTYDVHFHGDRTDVHVVMSLMFASFLRIHGTSCALFDVGHPAVEDELWGRHFIPVQSPLYNTPSWSAMEKACSKLIALLVSFRTLFWDYAGCPCEACIAKLGLTNNYRDCDFSDADRLQPDLFPPPQHVNYGSRPQPAWHFYYDMDNEVTVIESESLASFLTDFSTLMTDQKVVNGVNGKLIIHGSTNNYVDNQTSTELDQIFAFLLRQDNFQLSTPVLVMENMMVAVATPFVVALGRFGGIGEFKAERELVRLRHNMESEILFPVSLYEWEENPDPDQFEKLMKALLEREPNVKRVRRAGPVDQGDKGRDQIIEWEIAHPSLAIGESPPTRVIRCVGQSKISKTTVGKSKVQDIRDTVEVHDAQGYFLAVSSQISVPLTEALEKLKSKGIWTDWWNRDDIEARLAKNLDLLPQFPNVVKAKEQVRFVEKEKD